MNDLILTHILQTDFMKEPGKTIAIVEIDITSALAIPLSSDFPKMWVKVSLTRRGVPDFSANYLGSTIAIVDKMYLFYASKFAIATI